MAQRRNVPLLPQTLHTDASVIAHQIKTGDSWFYAWLSQMGAPYVKLARLTGMKPARFEAIDRGDYVTRAELEALAKAWGASPDALIQSMPDPSMVVETKWTPLPGYGIEAG